MQQRGSAAFALQMKWIMTLCTPSDPNTLEVSRCVVFMASALNTFLSYTTELGYYSSLVFVKAMKTIAATMPKHIL